MVWWYRVKAVQVQYRGNGQRQQPPLMSASLSLARSRSLCSATHIHTHPFTHSPTHPLTHSPTHSTPPFPLSLTLLRRVCTVRGGRREEGGGGGWVAVPEQECNSRHTVCGTELEYQVCGTGTAYRCAELYQMCRYWHCVSDVC
eukprot:2219682-Rhodomonas_salina.1